MDRSKRKWDDRKIDVVLGNLLRTGVIVSAVTVLAGGVLYFLQSGAEKPGFHVFHGVPRRMLDLADLVGGALQLRSQSIIMIGLLLLIATPVARVVFSSFAFALERDRTYVVVTLIVLGFLLFSIFFGNLTF
jgi:uncharacterized membrane protein